MYTVGYLSYFPVPKSDEINTGKDEVGDYQEIRKFNGKNTKEKRGFFFFYFFLFFLSKIQINI